MLSSFFKSYTAGCKFNQIAIAQNDVPAKALILIKSMFGASLRQISRQLFYITLICP